MHIPRKRFGQHFLHDRMIIQKIVAAINPKPHEQIVEIGPGEGALTIPLLKLISHLDVIEIDRDLIAILQQNKALTVHAVDVLKFNFRQIYIDKPLRIIGNLPYNISTPLLFHLLEFGNIIADMTFMLQKEVAERIVAVSGEQFGRLSIMVQYHCTVHKLFDVAPQAFIPPPKVMSSIIQLIPRKNLPFSAKVYKVFCDIVKASFHMRRKTLRNNLRDFISSEQWQAIGIDPSLRAENLTVADFVKITHFLTSEPT